MGNTREALTSHFYKLTRNFLGSETVFKLAQEGQFPLEELSSSLYSRLRRLIKIYGVDRPNSENSRKSLMLISEDGIKLMVTCNNSPYPDFLGIKNCIEAASGRQTRMFFQDGSLKKCHVIVKDKYQTIDSGCPMPHEAQQLAFLEKVARSKVDSKSTKNIIYFMNLLP